jgi:hypothetical protein
MVDGLVSAMIWYSPGIPCLPATSRRIPFVRMVEADIMRGSSDAVVLARRYQD